MDMDMLSRVFDILQRAGEMERIGQIMTIVYGVICVFGILNCLLGYRILDDDLRFSYWCRSWFWSNISFRS